MGFSKLIGLKELLDLLTERQEAVRLIPIPVSSREARFIEGLVESNSKEEPELLPWLLQRKANRGEAQSLMSADLRGGKRGASINLSPGEGQGWVREMFGSPE